MPTNLTPRTERTVLPGRTYPLGATPAGDGVNFAIFSQCATEVFLLLFDDPAGDPTDVIRFEERTRNIWHAFVRGVGPGTFYGYRMRGPFDPARGLRFNENKLLIDPYAKALSGKARNHANMLLPYDPGSAVKDLSLDVRDNTRIVPKAIVIDDRFDWQGDVPPGIPLEKMVIYEVHLKGFTAHPSSGVPNPGTYLGFIEKIPHLQQLGVNAVELLPVQEFYVDDFLIDRGLTNYWGYNTIGFFTPESSYAAGSRPGCQVEEFKTLVRALHRAGIEVILDVVYNHTGEGNERGPMLSFRGIDNPSYYALAGPPEEPGRFYLNITGCGNSLNLSNPATIRLVMDSLRYWVEAMHVDGFRFDLASVLGRENGMFDKSASFFDAISQDPELNRIKLIAEPWDLGTYQVGSFPIDWSEWNGRFRDTVRRFGKGDANQVRDLGWRLTGSADLYGDDGRSPYNSINFITCHDGFTLRDLVSYNGKHNEANGEDNRDGADDNNSWNCGIEGETDAPEILRLRRQLAKNYICMLLFSSGTPMLLGGDEFLRTQGGNNNGYCQDNVTSWFDWRDAERNADFLAFTRKAIAFMRRFPLLQRRKFYGGGGPEIAWFGRDLDAPAWDDPELRTLAYMLGGRRGPRLFFILNADYRSQGVALPPSADHAPWRRVIDTCLPAGEDFAEEGSETTLDNQIRYLASPRSMVVLIGA
jgi:glycogen operon protein